MLKEFGAKGKMNFRKLIPDIIIFILATVAAITVYFITASSELPTVIGSLVFSYLFAKYFGDVAGQKAAQDFAEQEAQKSQILSIKSLINEVQIARDLAVENLKLVEKDNVQNNRGAIRMPVRVFETALVSKDSALLYKSDDSSDFQELLALLRAYLTKAYSINSLIDVRLAAIISHGTGGEQRTYPTREIKAISEGLPKILDGIEENLKKLFETILSE